MNAGLRRQVRSLESRAGSHGGRVCGTCGKTVATGRDGGRIELRVPMPAVMGADAPATRMMSHSGCPECEPVIVLTVPPPRRFGEA